jgi:hypothetical protein
VNSTRLWLSQVSKTKKEPLLKSNSFPNNPTSHKVKIEKQAWNRSNRQAVSTKFWAKHQLTCEQPNLKSWIIRWNLSQDPSCIQRWRSKLSTSPSSSLSSLQQWDQLPAHFILSWTLVPKTRFMDRYKYPLSANFSKQTTAKGLSFWRNTRGKGLWSKQTSFRRCLRESTEWSISSSRSDQRSELWKATILKAFPRKLWETRMQSFQTKSMFSKWL